MLAALRLNRKHFVYTCPAMIAAGLNTEGKRTIPAKSGYSKPFEDFALKANNFFFYLAAPPVDLAAGLRTCDLARGVTAFLTAAFAAGLAEVLGFSSATQSA